MVIFYLWLVEGVIEGVYGEKHPYVAITLNNMGDAWAALGDSQRAKECFQQAHSIEVERKRQ